MTDDLRALQQRFQAYLTGASEAFRQDIISTDSAPAEQRLKAYYDAYRIRLIDCLANDFSGLHKELGDDGFETMVLEYLQHYPSHYPSVRWVGSSMVEFLRHSGQPEAEFFAELAEFEWTQGLCFDAKNAATRFTLDDMAQIAASDWPQLTFRFQPSLRWLDLYWNIPVYWVALDEEADPLPPKQRDDYPTRWLMWRKHLSPHWRSLDVAEAWAIEAAANGANFATLCEGLLEWIGEDAVAITAAGYLKQWIHDDLMAQVLHAP